MTPFSKTLKHSDLEFEHFYSFILEDEFGKPSEQQPLCCRVDGIETENDADKDPANWSYFILTPGMLRQPVSAQLKTTPRKNPKNQSHRFRREPLKTKLGKLLASK